MSLEKPSAAAVRHPTCPNCSAAKGTNVLMKGPVLDPHGTGHLYFTCDDCNYMLKDRRAIRRTETARA